MEEKAKNIKNNAQNSEFWQSNQMKLKQGAVTIFNQLENVKSKIFRQ